MVKNFSVDWLAQSYHNSKHDDETNETQAVRRHVPCLVQPRPPTSYDKIYIQPKQKCRQTEQNTTTDESKENMFTPPAVRNCSSPSSSENSGYSSGYESEAATSECLSIEDGSEYEKDGGVQRRIRTKFTPEQIVKLEKLFRKHKYLDASERAKAAQKLNLSETQIRTWFQNRRMKMKREVQDIRPDYALQALPHVLFPAITSLPLQCYSGQRVSYPPVHHIPSQHVIPPMPVHHPMSHQQIHQQMPKQFIPQHGHMIPVQQYY
ncbi:homeobox protein vent1-like [Trichomycterus rosablanca]|uniref:homeobox protein vent1-like n=1 Tax=Trichomycterus rosablanca TaxID=2290929 RepID=UPI002F354ADA